MAKKKKKKKKPAGPFNPKAPHLHLDKKKPTFEKSFRGVIHANHRRSQNRA